MRQSISVPTPPLDSFVFFNTAPRTSAILTSAGKWNTATTNGVWTSDGGNNCNSWDNTKNEYTIANFGGGAGAGDVDITVENISVGGLFVRNMVNGTLLFMGGTITFPTNAYFSLINQDFRIDSAISGLSGLLFVLGTTDSTVAIGGNARIPGKLSINECLFGLFSGSSMFETSPGVIINDRISLNYGGGISGYGCRGVVSNPLIPVEAGIVVDSAGGRLYVNAPTVMTVESVISGPGNLTLRFAGSSEASRIRLTNANTYAGGTSIISENENPASVLIGDNLAFSTGDIALTYGGRSDTKGFIFSADSTNNSPTVANTINFSTIENQRVCFGTSYSTGTMTFTGSWVMGANIYTLSQLRSGENTNINGIISGSGASIRYLNEGTLTIGGNNTYTGGTTFVSGSVTINHANALGTTGNISFRGGSLVYGSGITTDISGRLDTATASTIKVNTGFSDVIWASDIGGVTAIEKSGRRTLVLSGNNNTIGASSVKSGTLQLGNGGVTGGFSYGSVDVGQTGTLTFSTSNTHSTGIVITGAGRISKIQSNNITFTNQSDITGTFAIATGAVIAGRTNVFGTSAIITLSGGTFSCDTFSQSVLSIRGSGGTLNLPTSGTFTVTGLGEHILGSSITGGPTGVFSKSNTGVLTIRGNNTFSGTFNILTGGVVATGATSLTSGTGTFVVSPGAYLNISGISTSSAAEVKISGTGIDGSGALSVTAAAAANISMLTLTADSYVTVTGTGTPTFGFIRGGFNIVLYAPTGFFLGGASVGVMQKMGGGDIIINSASATTSITSLDIYEGNFLGRGNFIGKISVSEIGGLYLQAGPALSAETFTITGELKNPGHLNVRSDNIGASKVIVSSTADVTGMFVDVIDMIPPGNYDILSAGVLIGGEGVRIGINGSGHNAALGVTNNVLQLIIW